MLDETVKYSGGNYNCNVGDKSIHCTSVADLAF